MMRISRAVFALLMAQPAMTVSAMQPVAELAPLAVLQSQDERVARIGEALTIASVDLCAAPVWRPGFEVQYLAQYRAAEAAALRPHFAVADAATVMIVVPASGADQSGLHRGDSLIAIDGQPLPRDSADGRPRFTATAAAMALIATAFTDGVATLTIARDGREAPVPVTARRGCASQFLLLPSTRLDAEADGHYVQLTSAQVELAADDDELASTLAHELAHNILRHRARLNAAGVQRGLLAHVGRNAALFRQSEIEADRLSVYLMALAGYDPDAALRMIDRLAARSGPVMVTTHPGWDRRRTLIGADIARIRQLQADGEAIRPDFDLSGTAPLSPDD